MQRVTYTLGPESPIPERELLEVVEAAVNSVSSNIYLVGVGSNVCLSKRGERSLWEGDIRMAAFQNDGDLGASPGAITSDDLQPFIVEAKGDADLLGQTKSAHFLAVEIGKRVFSFLLEQRKPCEHRALCLTWEWIPLWPLKLDSGGSLFLDLTSACLK